MQKLADTTYPIEPLLKQRWSPRAFAARPVEIEKLLSLWGGPLVGFLRQSTALVLYRGHQGGAS